MNENILNKIRARKDFFSGVDRKLAELILSDPKKFITYSMTELAEVSGVSQGSIINFSRKVSGGGFSALKMQIAQDSSFFKPQKFNIVSEGDGVKDVIKKSIEDMTFFFGETMNLNSEEKLQRVVKMIMKAKRIEIYGIFQSGIVAKDFYYQLLQLGLPAMYVTDALMCPVSASMLDKDCLAIAVSGSGKTKDILDTIKIAKENNVPAICLTRNENSPIAKLCDETLIISAGGTSISNIDVEIRLAQLFLIDCLCSYIRHNTEEHGEKQFFKLRDILSSHSVED